jgi:signal transduction histidine kinase/CheY-like chemotaxis protein/HPt (histidine-containing phosphotransfer) domain-containing protein
LEDAVEKLSRDLVVAGIIDSSETKNFRSAAKYRETGQFSEITWKLNLLQDIHYGSEMLRHELGYAMGVALERDDLSQILYSRIPTFAQEMHKTNFWLKQTFEEVESQRARLMISKRSSELTQLRTLGEDLDQSISNLNKQIFNSEDLDETRLRVGALFEKYDYDARKLLEKKRKLSVLDLLGQSEGNGLRKAELESLWELGQSVSTDLLQSTKLLERLMESEIVSHRDTIRSNRNWTLILVSTNAILALVLGYYILKNMSIVHETLKAQNQRLEESIRNRVVELEQARAGAMEAAAIAERERNHAIELNDVLQEQTEISNALARKAVAAEKAKSQFLANISHEIRTPMNGVVGMTHLLRESGLNETQTGHVDTLGHCADALLVLIDDVLDLSKIEAGKLRIEATETDLNEVIEKTVALYAPTAHQKGLELLCFYPILEKRKLLLDPYRLRQVFSNLISNAIKFTDKGFVRFDADLLEDGDDRVVYKFTVRDTGLGISEEHQKNLYRPFTQGDCSTTRKFGGTGLGLAISQKLVSLMNGQLDVLSEEGQGSEFSFTLTFKTPGSKIPKVHRDRFSGEKALVLSHSEVVANYLKKAVEYLGLPCDLKEKWEDVENAEQYKIAFLDEGVPASNISVLESRLACSKVVVVAGGRDTEKWVLGGEIEDLKRLERPCEMKILEEFIADSPSVKPMPASRGQSFPKLYNEFNVLLVDDNEINLLVAEGLLEKYGIRPTKVSSGELALEKCEKNEYDIIFMDCMMPGMDGYQATKEIRTRDSSLNVRKPIVALTANAMKGDREKCLKSGMSDYLSKPLRTDELESVLEKWLIGDQEEVLPVVPLIQDATTLVDLSEFRRLFEVGDERSLASFLATIVESLNENLLALEKAISGVPDLAEMRTITADIKGSALSLGAERLNRLADKLEDACKNGKSEEAIELFGELKRLSKQTQEAVGEFAT